jgi:Protein of unknown function (DUF3102)
MTESKPQHLYSPDQKTLADLATAIDAAHSRVCNHVLQFAIEAGKALIKAKAICPPGEWTDYVHFQCHIYPHTAQRYIRLASNIPLLEQLYLQSDAPVSFSVRGALAALAKPKPKRRKGFKPKGEK